MKKFEVLSPAGDMESFKVAVSSGADAVYFGLNKFNARMKADNISLDTLAEVVEYAHLRDVKLYLTINTLIATNEMKELVEMVGHCIECGVDAFIVQDIGVISVLKSVFPNIVLHGSTQLGVHNERGARVAKAMGLTRVVLSREVTLEDIIRIRKNVDIELEVFVQGAMCVCFSGNCYFSSLKCSASGNRGLCKQLCRLPYTMSSRSRKSKGYMLSPRDNCMIDYLKELCDAGVVSFKIEGRLRRPGYVGVATRVYRNAIDSINCGVDFDKSSAKRDLSKVFSRGEFVPAYFEGNGIIDTRNNNHMGEKIGVVIKSDKFKDIYRITINSSKPLATGDGLKFVNKETTQTLGVGNIDYIGNYQVVYGKNYINAGSEVYRVLDSEFESQIANNVRKRILDIKVVLRIGEPFLIAVECDNYIVQKYGAIVQCAKTRALERSDVVSYVVAFGEEAFELGSLDCMLDEGAFLPVSEIKSVRREVVDMLKQQILNSYKLPIVKNEYPQLCSSDRQLTYDKLAIVDEECNLKQVSQEYSALIFSPTIYSLDVVKKFYHEYVRYFNTSLIINLPIIAKTDDLLIIDKIVEFATPNNMILLANNIYALDYIGSGATVWAGANMNVVSEYTVSALNEMGVAEVVSSIEKWYGGVRNTYKMCNGNRVLMTMATCPYKTLNGKACKECSYSGRLNLKNESGEYYVRRLKVSNCYFELVDGLVENKTANHSIDDLRR